MERDYDEYAYEEHIRIMSIYFLHLINLHHYVKTTLRLTYYSIVTSVISTTFPRPFAIKGDKSNDIPLPPPWPFRRSACLFGRVSMNITIGPDPSYYLNQKLTCHNGASVLGDDI